MTTDNRPTDHPTSAILHPTWSHAREGVIIECPLNWQNHDRRDVILTSRMAVSNNFITVTVIQNIYVFLLLGFWRKVSQLRNWAVTSFCVQFVPQGAKPFKYINLAFSICTMGCSVDSTLGPSALFETGCSIFKFFYRNISMSFLPTSH